MRNKTILYINVLMLIIVVFSFNSCKKDIADNEKDYIGTWKSDNGCATLEITSDGSVHYVYFDNAFEERDEDVEGRVNIKNGKLKIIKNLIVKKKFEIDQEPTVIIGQYHYMMKLRDDSKGFNFSFYRN